MSVDDAAVPVQITDTEPIASMAGRRRTMAFRRAMACTPIASVMVMTAGSPSGMAATATPTTAMNSPEKSLWPTA